MANKLDVKTTALALATTSAIVYVACVLLVLIFGAQGVSLFAKMFHGIDITKIATTTVSSFTDIVTGFVELIIFALLTGVLFAKVYNLFVKSK